MTRSLLLLSLCASCASPAPEDVPPDVPSLPDEPIDTEVPADSEPVELPPWHVEADCDAAVALPTTYTTMDWVPSHEDFTFDTEGHLVGISASVLRRTPYGGPSEVVLSGLGNARGSRFLPDGSLVYAHADRNALIRVFPDGGTQRIRGGLPNANGIAIGLDGWVYLTKWEEVVRIHPDTGETEQLAYIQNSTLDGITFNHDYTRLYFNQEAGTVFYLTFDDEGQPSEVMEGPSLPISPVDILDGMTADACGNIYVIQMAGELWRISPEGEVDLVVEITERTGLPATNFGSGIGDWSATTLYTVSWGGRLHAVDLGVPGKWEPHLPSTARSRTP